MPRPAVAQAKPHRIDVHHHVSPPSWLDAVKKAKLDNPPMANWSVQKSLDDMDQAGIATAVVSPTTMGTRTRSATGITEYCFASDGSHSLRPFRRFALGCGS
jgi:hypothetical protein